jgi:hypothetical protein
VSDRVADTEGEDDIEVELDTVVDGDKEVKLLALTD